MAIEFNWAESGNSNFQLATGVTLTAGTINPNDLLIAVVVPLVPHTGEHGDGPLVGPPSGPVQPPPGWAQLDNTALSLDGVPANASIFYKVATGNESQNLNFSWSNQSDYSWTLLSYSGVDPTSPIDAFGGQTNTSAYLDETVAPSVTTTSPNDTLVSVWMSKGGAEDYTNDRTTTVRSNTHSNTYEFPQIMVADERLASAGATSPNEMDQLYSTVNQRGFSIALREAACFMAGTMIRTPDGECAVETMVRGDRVLTSDGQTERVVWIGRQTISMLFADPLRVLPVRIRANALGEQVPSRDFLLSPDHAILVRGVLIQAGALVNGTSIVRETKVPLTFTYYHVELEHHSLILAENTPAETFIDNVDRLAFDNWHEHEELYPEGKAIVEMPYARAKAHRQVPRVVRELLAARATNMAASSAQIVAA